MLNETTPTTPEAPRTAPKNLLNFMTRYRRQISVMLEARKELKALKEEFNETDMASEFDPAVWDGNNPALGVHSGVALKDLPPSLNALDLIENLLVEQNQLGPLLRIKE